jgi:uncharacterized protein with von Willebrand factor type A (vWA) domain
MSHRDRRPLADTPAADRIRRFADNRLGAVYSALYGFWSSRHAAVTAGQQVTGARRDAYSVILFEDDTENKVVNDFMSTPDELLTLAMLNVRAYGGTDFSEALRAAHAVMIQNWSTERLVYLSDLHRPVSF